MSLKIHKKLAAISLVLAILLCGGLFILMQDDKKQNPAPPAISAATDKLNPLVVKDGQRNNQELLAYAQNIFDEVLVSWHHGERKFINSNRDLFTSQFLETTIDSPDKKEAKTFLFCGEPNDRPTRFEVTLSSFFDEGRSASVYVNGLKNDESVISNVPIALKQTDGVWKIDSVSCDSDSI